MDVGGRAGVCRIPELRPRRQYKITATEELEDFHIEDLTEVSRPFRQRNKPPTIPHEHREELFTPTLLDQWYTGVENPFWFDYQVTCDPWPGISVQRFELCLEWCTPSEASSSSENGTRLLFE